MICHVSSSFNPSTFFASRRAQISAFQVVPAIFDGGIEVSKVTILANNQLTGDQNPEPWFQVFKKGYNATSSVIITGKVDMFVTPKVMSEQSFAFIHDPKFQEANPRLTKVIEHAIESSPKLPLINLRSFFGMPDCTMEKITREFGLDEFWIFETPRCRVPPSSQIKDGFVIPAFKDKNGVTKPLLLGPQGEFSDYLLERKRETWGREDVDAWKEEQEAVTQLIQLIMGQREGNHTPATENKEKEDPYDALSRG